MIYYQRRPLQTVYGDEAKFGGGTFSYTFFHENLFTPL
jgi:hypothetical protein